MRKFYKRLLSAALALVTAASAVHLPSVAAADNLPDGWNIQYSLSTGSATVDNSTFYNGNGSLKVVNNTPYGANQYVILSQTVHVKAGRLYYIGGYVKAEDAPNIAMMCDWGTRYSMTTFGKTHDWKNFTVAYSAAESKNVTLQFILDDKCGAVWFDDMKFTDAATGENLLQNPGFDTESVQEEVTAPPTEDVSVADKGIEDAYNAVMNSEYSDRADVERVSGGLKHIYVGKADGISVDGNSADWENFPAYTVPTHADQYIVYMKDGRTLDASAQLKFAYDEKNLYMLAEVTDDTFCYREGGQNEYWQGDSIQLAWSTSSEEYGNEIGLAYNPKTGKGEIYSTAYSAEQMATMKLEASQEGNKTVYELSMPWDLKFAETPEELLYCVVINDNDGDGRRYCMEFAPGIASGKTNAQFVTLEPDRGQRDWYAWFQADGKKAMQNEDMTFDWFLVNTGEEKTFTVTDVYTGEEEKIVLPKDKAYHKKVSRKFETPGKFNVGIKADDGATSYESSMKIEIESIPADAQTSEKVLQKIKSETEEIKSLLDKCSVKGISTQYETGYHFIMDRFCTYTEEEITRGDYSRINYTAEAFEELYAMCKENLNAYLDGTKQPETVPMYVTSDLSLDGKSMIATVNNDGTLEERPVFFVGYLGYGQQQADTPYFNTFGANSGPIEIHMGITKYNPSVFNGWALQKSSAPEVEVTRCETTKKDGTMSAKIVYSSDKAANKYMTLNQKVAVEPGVTYVLKGWVKGKGVGTAWISANGFNDRVYINGDYDWKEVKTAITVPEGTTETGIYIAVEDKCTELYADGFTFCEEGSDEDLLENGSFDDNDEIVDEDFPINPNFAESVEAYLTSCDENNVALAVALGPHVFPDDLIKKYNIAYNGVSFIKHNITYPEAMDAVEKHTRAVMEAIGDHKSVHTIIISNEFDFKTSLLADYYIEDWRNYLREKYNNDIDALNRSYTTEHTSFDEIDFQTGSPAKLYDFKKYNDKVCAEWHKFITDIVHEYKPDMPVSAKHMSYLSDNMARGHLLNNGTGMEDYIEFFDLNGCDVWNYWEDSHGPLTKNMWYDYLVSLKDAPIFNSEDHIITDASGNFFIENDDYVAQDIYQGAIHGRARSDIWAWYRDYSSSSSLNNSILFRVGAVAKVSKAAFDLNKNAYEITALQNETADVGIVYEDASALNDNTAMQAVYQSYAAATYAGKKSLFVVGSQAYKMQGCRVVIVPNQKYVRADIVTELRKFIENGGKVLILGEDSLKLTEGNLPNNQEDLDFIFANSTVMPYIGVADHMTQPSEEELYEKVRTMLDEISARPVAVTDAQTGDATVGIEYNVGVYDGKLLVNLVNYGDDRNINIYVGGKLMEKAHELRDNYDVGSEITLERYKPITLEIEVDNVFLDTIGHWAEEKIVELSNEGVLKGTAASRFSPDRSISRAEILALLMRKTGMTASEGYELKVADVDKNDWFFENVKAAASNGIIDAEEPFRPNDKATREEMCELLVKCYEKLNGKITADTELAFSDNADITKKEYVTKAVSKELMLGMGDNTFAPLATATRAEAAVILSKFN